MTLADNIRRIRLQKQITQPLLAEKAGVSKGYINTLEAGVASNPSLDVLGKIASALDTTIAELIGQPRTEVVGTATELPDELVQFAHHHKKMGEPLSEEDILNLAAIRFRGKRPETVEDWAYVYEFFKRTFGDARK